MYFESGRAGNHPHAGGIAPVTARAVGMVQIATRFNHLGGSLLQGERI